MTAVSFKEQDVSADYPAHAGAKRQEQVAQGDDGGVFAQTGQLLNQAGQRHALGAAAGTGKEERCGHGEPR